MGDLEPSWGRLGASWERLGGVLEASWTSLGRLGGVLRASWGRLEGVLGRLGEVQGEPIGSSTRGAPS